MQHKHYETAKRAHYWTSFHPDKRAQDECKYFDEICTEFADKPEVIAKFERLFLLSLAAKSRCASSMITGSAKFPIAKQEKASARERKITDEMLAYIERARKAINKPESTVISSDDENAIDKLKAKLDALTKAQEVMVQANKLIRKGDNAGLVALLGEERAAEVLKLDCFGGIGFADFELRNNNARIKQVEGRIKEIESRKATTPKDFMIGNVRCVENTEAMRLQLFFEGKPAANIISTLKSHGFKWAPSVMAWQRQLTNNAVWSFNHFVLPVLKAGAI